MKIKYSLKSKSNVEITLGNLNQITTRFYMSRRIQNKNEYFICEYEIPIRGTYEENKGNVLKYDFLKELFQKEERYFFKKEILDSLKIEDIDEIDILNISHLKFKINLKTMSTVPSSYEGLGYSENKIRDDFESLKKLKFEKIHIASQDSLSHRITVLNLHGLKSYKLELYSRYKTKTGFFLYYNKKNLIYELPYNPQGYFMADIQDYWMKRIQFDENELKKSEIPMSITLQNGEKFNFIIDNKVDLNFRILNKGYSVDERNFKRVLHLLLGISEFENAFRVSKNILNDGIKIEIFNRIFFIVGKHDELLLSEKNSNYSFHYLISKADFDIDKDFFLFTKKVE